MNTKAAKSTQRQWNPGTLRLLEKKGTNLSRIHKIINVFHIFEKERIADLRIALTEKGFEICNLTKITENDEITYWSLHAQVEFVPSTQLLNEMTDGCIDLAYSFGADYDGWYTQPVD